jgi:hypothetical protein
MQKLKQYYTNLILWLIKPAIGPLFDEVITAIDQLRTRKIDWEEVQILCDNKLQKK